MICVTIGRGRHSSLLAEWKAAAEAGASAAWRAPVRIRERAAADREKRMVGFLIKKCRHPLGCFTKSWESGTRFVVKSSATRFR